MLVDSAWPLVVLGPFLLQFVRCSLASLWLTLRGRPLPFEVELDAGSFGRAQTWLRRVGAWSLQPVCGWLIAIRVRADTLTLGSMLLSVAGGVSIGLGAVTLGGVLGLMGCSLDYFDGRVARASASVSRAGAFLDGTLDRCGEFALLGGAALLLRGSVWALLACLVALSAGALVSYARAKGEALGHDLRGGLMQRPERALLLCVGACAGHAVDGVIPAEMRGDHALFTATLALLALLTAHTAWQRVLRGFRELRRDEAAYNDAGHMTGIEHAPISHPRAHP